MSWIEWNEKAKSKALTQTLDETLQLFFQDYSIEQIAKKRSMKIETIERQIIELITKSFISVDSFVDKTTQQKISNLHIYNLKEIKNSLPEEITWFEIKATLASINAKPKK